ncbi:Bud site selection protein, Revert to axial protein 1 [Arachnomyces sp. PD_36]|nr:Bud site selection protein, Revert to axial protein 1 [Arachnomyces sp. PD_36]
MDQSSFPDMEQRNRLPTLLEVLSRRTLAPVDLFSFYIYMRDQQRSVDYLDFWLDVSQHMSLCRHYVRELRRSVLVDTPDLEKSGSKRSSQILDDFAPGDLAGPSHTRDGSDEKDKTPDQHLSAFLRSEGQGQTSNHSPQSSLGSQYSARQAPSSERPPRPSFMTTPDQPTDSNSPGHTVARADIRASAEKILYTYLLPGSEREVILPDHMITSVIRMIEEEGRDDPEVFDSGKDYVFQAMERDAFPGFLQAKALGNLVPLSIVGRLAIALASFGGGFWGAFYVVLTDQSRATRCWVILPFIFAGYFLASYQYKLDMILAFAGFSEYTFMNWARIREPYVRNLIRKRAVMASLIAFLIAVALSVIFIFVPGTKL